MSWSLCRTFLLHHVHRRMLNCMWCAISKLEIICSAISSMELVLTKRFLLFSEPLFIWFLYRLTHRGYLGEIYNKMLVQSNTYTIISWKVYHKINLSFYQYFIMRKLFKWVAFIVNCDSIGYNSKQITKPKTNNLCLKKFTLSDFKRKIWNWTRLEIRDRKSVV